MKANTYIILSILISVCLLLPQSVAAKDITCASEYPHICSFLQRYIAECREWKNPDLSLERKLKDDKFLILQGSFQRLDQTSDSTTFSVIRYDDKAYEAYWNNGTDTLLHIAFPIQYELILGLPQNEIEKQLQQYIKQAPQREELELPYRMEKVTETVYATAPKQHYQLPEVNNQCFFLKDSDNQWVYLNDTAYAAYTIANLFQQGLERNYQMRISQSLYGFKKQQFTVSLQQWLNYCAAEQLTCYIAIEQETTDAMKVLIVAESKDLAYNHILSALVPKDLLNKPTGTILCKINAFIPTHNLSTLYKENKKK